MRIHKLEIENFRCFKSQEFPFARQFNVLAGDNGTGKTTVLEAIAVAAGAFLQEMDVPQTQTRPFQNRDVHLKQISFDREKTLERQFPVAIKCEGEINDQKCSWTREWKSARGRPSKSRREPISALAYNLYLDTMNGRTALLPLLAYYGTGRLWAQRRHEKGFPQSQTGLFAERSRLSGYDNALSPSSNDKKLFEWLKLQKLISLDEREPSVGFECVRQAVASCLSSHGWDGLDYGVREDSLMIVRHTALEGQGDVTRLPFDYLSDGYRNTIAMVADIARRAVLLNPQFGTEAARKTPGIVLIDEIDLHLHPKWQRTIVDDLKRTFPLVQFFATSHSPYIIQSLDSGELLDLDPDENLPCPDDAYSDESIEDISENVMGVPGPRSKRLQKMYEVAKQYYQLIELGTQVSAAEVESIKRSLDELSAPYSKNVAYYAFLERKRVVAGLGDAE